MKLRWHPDARAEADSAAAFYAEKRPGIAQRFLDDLEIALRRVQRHPQAYRRVDGDIRKCRVPHFPCGVIDRVRFEHIEILAVMHLRKAPDYWRQRR